MKIQALTTGTVSVKHAFLFPSGGPRRQLDLFLPSPWSDPMPIHFWAIEHDGRLLLIDSGETASARNVPFARFDVAREQELPAAMAAEGLSLEAVSEVVLTHHHGDHVDGLIHVRAPVRIHDTELRFLGTAFSRGMRRVLRQPLPPQFAPEPFGLDGGPFGAFPRSHALSDDGRIVAVDGAKGWVEFYSPDAELRMPPWRPHGLAVYIGPDAMTRIVGELEDELDDVRWTESC
jgi:glyoxylase-like metal-dependent hydrolase (beta-lactamase superfamily II)